MKNIILAGIGTENSSATYVIDRIKLPVSKLLLNKNPEKSLEILLSEIEKKNALCVILIG